MTLCQCSKSNDVTNRPSPNSPNRYHLNDLRLGPCSRIQNQMQIFQTYNRLSVCTYNSIAMQTSLRDRAIDITRYLNTFDIDAIRGLLSDSPDFHFRFGPESALQSLGKPGGFNKEEVLEFFGNHRGIVKQFNVRCSLLIAGHLLACLLFFFCSNGNRSPSFWSPTLWLRVTAA